MRFFLLVLLLGLVGCRETITGPVDPPLDLSPDVVGEYAGVFEGELGLIGVPDSTIRDTFRLTLDIRPLEAEPGFRYEGEVLRGGTAPVYLYGCGPGALVVSEDRRAQINCVQGTQLGDTLIFRVDAQFDTTFAVLRGVIYDVLGSRGTQYEVDLYRGVEPE